MRGNPRAETHSESPKAMIDLPKYATQHGYMTEKVQREYITAAIAQGLLPEDAHRMPEILSLTAPADRAQPVQFWQLYSLLGQEPLVRIVQDFYQRVFADEEWFTSVFARVGDVTHHINTQASMWIDVMGGGPYYHGAEFRLSFHHTHNAMQLMTDRGAERWSQLMLAALDASAPLLAEDPRLRVSLNTFLTHFMGKYAAEFAFEHRSVFGETNPPFLRKINLRRMSEAAIEALSEAEISAALRARGVDVSRYQGKADLVNKALML
ncbi:hypothetical protein [Pararhodobacter oceanensis]|uniref:globin domain-containing protein n=1 Tax=Pararhodobacter oceanensis TaxID=2172121 RepID=UPI003A8F8499